MPTENLTIEVKPPQLCRSIVAGALVWIDEEGTQMGVVVRVNKASIDVRRISEPADYSTSSTAKQG